MAAVAAATAAAATTAATTMVPKMATRPDKADGWYCTIFVGNTVAVARDRRRLTGRTNVERRGPGPSIAFYQFFEECLWKIASSGTSFVKKTKNPQRFDTKVNMFMYIYIYFYVLFS